MDKIYNLLMRLPLFSGIPAPELPGLLASLAPSVQNYEKGHLVLPEKGDPVKIAVLLTGSVNLVQDDDEGNRSLIAQYTPGDVLGDIFVAATGVQFPKLLLCTSTSYILTLDVHSFLETTSEPTNVHYQLSRNLSNIFREFCAQLNKKVFYTSRRSTREKLLAFLYDQATPGTEFTISLRRQDMADYLCVERSAMSAELSKLKSQGLIQYDKNTFTCPPVPKAKPKRIAAHSASAKGSSAKGTKTPKAPTHK